ncbi:MAG: diguanylate cyclase (GGDEF)-like protein [Bermanella sp.]|jgi:diguanylate cyclase (GGDEF)-like protein
MHKKEFSMRLNYLLLLTALIYMLILSCSLLAYRVFITYPKLQNSALDLQNRNLQSTFSTLRSKMDDLSSLNFKWAKSDETYGYLAVGDPEYISRNILRPSFLKYDIDAVIILNSDGSVKYSGKKENEKFISSNHSEALSSDFNINKIINSDDQQGLVTIGNDLAYFSSHQVQDSEFDYDPSGAVVFIKLITADFFAQIRLLTDLKLSIKKPGYLSTLHSKEGILESGGSDILKLRPTHYIPLNNQNSSVVAIMKLASDPDKIPSIFDTTIVIAILGLALLPIVLTLAIWKIFIRPATHVFHQIRCMEENGSISFITNKSNIHELDNFTNKFNALVEKIHSHQLELKKQSLTDSLTGIPNRRQFDKRFDESWRSSVRYQSPICIIMIDIDYFKSFNDHYGHQAGDDALIQVANELNRYVRRSSDLLARYGGEEFIAVVKTSNEEEVREVLETIRKCIEKLKIPHIHSEVASHITVSSGACLIDEPGMWMKDKMLEAIKISDMALYQSKDNGRNTFTINHLIEDKLKKIS